MPSELLLLVLPSVDSRLPCRVTLFRISTAMPVSVLRRMVLRSFFGPPSGSKHADKSGWGIVGWGLKKLPLPDSKMSETSQHNAPCTPILVLQGLMVHGHAT